MEHESMTADEAGEGVRGTGSEPVGTATEPPAGLTGEPPQPSRAPAEGHAVSDSPEHAWSAAMGRIFPVFRPLGTAGLAMAEIDLAEMREQSSRARSQPLVDEGCAGLPIVYVIHGEAYDVIINGEHLLTWGVEITTIQDTALHNLVEWSAGAPWTDEVSGERRLLSSDSGDGWDASRILLEDVREHLFDELGSAGRVLVGLPERHLLVAGPLRPDDAEFAALFADFVVETSGGADEPIDRRVLELLGRDLVEFRA
jgi:hypothetical protein